MPSSIVAVWTALVAAYQTYSVVAFAINMVASAIISKAFFSPSTYDQSGNSPNPGNRQQLAPATDNKLPVVYGSAWLGGIVTDLSITSDNQNMYYVLALSEVTGTSGSPDNITFGDIYYGGKKVIFDSNGYSVSQLLDESTGIYDSSVNGYMDIFLYKNGSSNPTNSGTSAITIMQTSGLVYTWNSNKLMTNCAFAIIHLKYNQSAGITGLQQTKFNVINSRYATGDCVYDYLTNTRYGCSIPTSQIDSTSLATLTAYSNQSFTYTTNSGGTSTQARFRFDGVIDTQRTCMQNLQDMMSCCDALLTYNQITAQWGVITQQPTYTVAMNLNDSNIVSAIQVTPIDLAGSYNVIECKFPDKTSQDSFNTSVFNLAQIAPSLLFPNEPVNKMSVSLPLVNNSVRAQYIANRLLKGAREDLQLQLTINFVGIQLQAGDIVTVTNDNYGWSAKPFRINKVIESFGDDGSVTAKLTLTEFNSTVYNDVSITEFTPAPNTGISSPTVFGTVPAPVVASYQDNSAVPSISIQVTASSAGIIQYADVYYSAYSSPTDSQLIFAGTSAIQPSGNPYLPNATLPLVTITNLPAGNWYFFTKMVNSFGKSQLSSASTVFNWRPLTFQYANRYLSIAYATSSTGAGFSFTPSGKTYFGIVNQNTTTPDPTASDYIWYPATFSTNKNLIFCNRGSNLISFGVDVITQAAGSGAYIPTTTVNYDPSIWNGLPSTSNIIDLSMRSGQLIQIGTTTVGTGEIAITNDSQGQIVASLAQLLNFGTGVYTNTFSAAQITVDIYGRIIGVVPPDSFYYTMTAFTATSGQTVFSVTRGSGYMTGNCLVFENGLLLNPTEYTDNTGNVTFSTGRTVGDIITIISMRSVSALSITTTGASGTGTTATLTFGSRPSAPFLVGQSITVSGVTPSAYNGTYIVTACTTTSVSYASTATGAQTVAGTVQFTNNVYSSFTRNSVTLTAQSSYTASGFTINNGYEFLFLNGTAVMASDYNIVGQTITFTDITTADLEIIQWTPNNLSQPNGSVVNSDINTTIGTASYNFSYDPNAFNLYNNGVLQLETVDYAVTTGIYTLTQTPTSNLNIMGRQTFTRAGAA